MRAFDNLREVYGVSRITFKEASALFAWNSTPRDLRNP